MTAALADAPTRPFAELFAGAAARKGAAELEASLPAPADPDALAATPDDRWLSAFSRAVFSAGFNWKVVEAKWPRFETVFEGFDPRRMAMMSEEDLDRYLAEDGVIRHARKILSIRDNAALLLELARKRGAASGGAAIARWPREQFDELIWTLKTCGSRLGGATAQYALRGMGVDGWIMSRDVVRALARERVVDREPSSRRDLGRVQAAFNRWRAESGRPLMQISRILAATEPGAR